MQKIAIQGVRGSFHDEAMSVLVPEAEPVECVTFQDVFEAVVSGDVESGIVAIENSIHGSINPVYRLLERHHLWVAGETTINVEQYLIGPKEAVVESLNNSNIEVRTMFPAFAQCELWLQEHMPLAKHVEMFDTAYSVQTVVEEQDPNCVAIAGKHAAAVYGGVVIAGPINDERYNHTRFLLLTKEQQDCADADRTSIILTTGHHAGALYEVLGIFAKAGLNLSKLDSHPVPSDTRHYAFYIDIDAGLETDALTQALSEIKTAGNTVKVLGSYKLSQ